MTKRLPHVSERGSEGLPIVFLHSLGGTRAHWNAQIEHFGEDRRTVALDLLGHGTNPTPWRGDISFDRVANDAVTTANHIGLERFVLAGHSFGSGVAIACASKLPNYIAGLLLADPIGDQRQAPAEEVSAFMAAIESDQYDETVRGFWGQILSGGKPSTRERVMADLLATPRRVVVDGFRAMTTFDPVTALQAYAGPKLSVTTPLNDSPYSLHQLIPDFPHVRISGTSHWLQMDSHTEFNAVLTRFLAGIERNERHRESLGGDGAPPVSRG